MSLAAASVVGSAQSHRSTKETVATASAPASSEISGGYIAVLDTDNHRVQVFDGAGNYLSQFEHGFDLPTGIALDSRSNLYVKDGNVNCQADKFHFDGELLFQFGACATDGIGLGIFDNVGSVAVDAGGDVWISSPDFYYMQKIDSAGNFLSIVCMANVGITGCNAATPFSVQPYGIALDASGNIYVTNVDPFTGYNVVKFSNAGVYLATIGSSGAGNGQFEYPENLAVSSSGKLYVADSENNRIQIFDSAGVYLSQFGSLGSGDGQFDYPVGLAFDASGNVYVGDVGNNRIQKFDSDGDYLSQFGSGGSGNGQFFAPYGVVVQK
jgi:DNA-binding beta-propeller fold protein YncE